MRTRVKICGITRVEDAEAVDYGDIPGYTATSVAEHTGRLVRGTAAGVPVVVVPGNHERSRIPHRDLADHPGLGLLPQQPGPDVLARRGPAGEALLQQPVDHLSRPFFSGISGGGRNIWVCLCKLHLGQLELR